MESVTEKLRIFVRSFGLWNSSRYDECCEQQVSMVQSHILYEICRTGQPSMQKVADQLGIDITQFSRQIKRLEKKGLVERQPYEKDRRVSLLLLTDEGLQVLEKIDHYMGRRIEQLFSTMTVFEREIVIRSLGVLNEAITKTLSCGKQLAFYK